MPLTLGVDTAGWTDHLRAVVAGRPGIVPVCKGNGYGFGIARLATVATGVLGADLVAIGTEHELPALAGTDCDVLVLTPDPGASADVEGGPDPARVIRTASTVGDVERLAGAGRRFVVECRTALERHGVVAADFGRLAVLLAGPAGAGFAGWGLHLPLVAAGSWGAAVRDRIGLLQAAGAPVPAVFVSHLRPTELAELSAAMPGIVFRPRVGTELWLGRRDVLHPVATVLDVHRLPAGTAAGYWQRRTRRDGAIVVVSGGTAHGIGLQAPPPPALRRRAAALRQSLADGVGRARSPFLLDGSAVAFHEPPHMQVSLLWVATMRRGRPSRLPDRGEQLPLGVRFTTTSFDVVRFDTDPAAMDHDRPGSTDAAPQPRADG